MRDPLVVVFFAVVSSALGLYRGWSRRLPDNKGQKANARITVNQNKIRDHEGKERVQEFGHKTKETTGGRTDEVR